MLKSCYDRDGLCRAGNCDRSRASWWEQRGEHSPLKDPSMLGWPELPPPTKRKRVVGNQEPPEVFGAGRFLQQLRDATNISHAESLLEAM